MWSFKKTIRQRRIEVRRPEIALDPWYKRWFEKPGSVTTMCFAIMFFIITCALNVLPFDQFNYRVGQYIPQDINSRVNFRFLEKNLDQAISEAQDSVPYSFKLNSDHINSIIEGIKQIPGILEQDKTLDKADPKFLADIGIILPDKTKLEQDDPEAKKQLAQAQAIFDRWIVYAKDRNKYKLTSNLRTMKNELEDAPFIIGGKEAQELQPSASKPINLKLLLGDKTVIPEDKTIVANDAPDIDSRLNESITDFPKILKPGVLGYLKKQIANQPVYLYDEFATDQEKLAIAKDYRENPPIELFKLYKKNDNLVKRSTAAPLYGGQLGLTQSEIELLKIEHQSYINQLNASDKTQTDLAELDFTNLNYYWRNVIMLASKCAVSGLIIILVCLYVIRYQPKIISETRKVFALVLLLTIALSTVKLTNYTLDLNPFIAIFPISITCIILAITYNQRFSLAVSTMITFLVAIQVQASLSLLIVLLTAVVACSLQIREIRTRSRLVVISILSASAVFAMVWLLGFYTETPWRFVIKDSLWAAGGTFLAGLVVQSLLPVIEILFGVATGSTLLEWCDASKPLLRRLAMEVPGTYNHSLQLGTMCEAAAESIGARGLLARVGAYYHDIGKINKPHYFTENQSTGENKHNKLSPAMSLLIILNHVKDGLELANQYGLPHQLREFIASHHGTTLVKYFYHTAKEQAIVDGTDLPDELQYRYPGPKPHSKEAAILMLADAAESSVRSMSEPTPTRITTQVHEIVTARLEDGQLDNCEMTLREVNLVEQSLVKSLCGMYHGRIAYPKDNDKKTESTPAKSEQQDNQNKPEDNQKNSNSTPNQTAIEPVKEHENDLADPQHPTDEEVND